MTAEIQAACSGLNKVCFRRVKTRLLSFHRFVQSKSNSTRQLLEFILQLQIFEQVMIQCLMCLLVLIGVVD